MKDYDSLMVEIEREILRSPIAPDLEHSRLTLEYFLKFVPDANEVMKISASAHDIERAVTGVTEGSLKDYSKILEFKMKHAKKSADITGGLMEKHGYSAGDIKEMRHYVEAHETGGDDIQNALMDADSSSWFNSNLTFYFKKFGEKRTKKKIEFMYGRLTSRAKEIVDKIEFEDRKVGKLFNEVLR